MSYNFLELLPLTTEDNNITSYLMSTFAGVGNQKQKMLLGKKQRKTRSQMPEVVKRGGYKTFFDETVLLTLSY